MQKVLSTEYNDQEAILVEEWQKTKKKDILDQILVSHYKIVLFIANKYSKLGFNYNDLVIEGMLGLFISLDKYDTNKKIKFGTYAYFWIRAKILTFITKFSSILSGVNQYSQNKIKQKYNKNDEEEEPIFYNHNKLLREISLDQKVYEDSDLSDFIPFDISIENDEIDQEFLEIMRIAMSFLTEQERFVIEKRYLIENAMSMQEISNHLGVSYETVRKAQKKAIDKIKTFILDKVGDIKGAIFVGWLLNYCTLFNNKQIN